MLYIKGAISWIAGLFVELYKNLVSVYNYCFSKKDAETRKSSTDITLGLDNRAPIVEKVSSVTMPYTQKRSSSSALNYYGENLANKQPSTTKEVNPHNDAESQVNRENPMIKSFATKFLAEIKRLKNKDDKVIIENNLVSVKFANIEKPDNGTYYYSASVYHVNENGEFFTYDTTRQYEESESLVKSQMKFSASAMKSIEDIATGLNVDQEMRSKILQRRDILL